MPSIRKVKTGSGKTAVQIVLYVKRKVRVLKHIGSAKSEFKIRELERQAKEFIERKYQAPLFKTSEQVPFTTIDSKYGLLYRTLSYRHEQLFPTISESLLKDLTIIRIVEPVSKRQSVKLLDRYFGIQYSLRHLYRKLPSLLDLKEDIEKSAVKTAKQRLGFDFTVVFYDVTTLYFETFKSDDLRKPGYSKDNKFNQPQILIGLIVTKEGFPVGHQVFEGNKYEGHTLLPSILKFKQENSIKKLTVVADAAMISIKNIEELKENNLNYIVGARLRNISENIVNQITDKLDCTKNGATTKIKIKHGYLICQFSKKGTAKTNTSLRKALRKPEPILKDPLQY